MAASISLQDRNKQIVAEYYREYWTLGNPDIVDKLCAEDFIVNYPMHGPRQGREAAKQMLLEFKRVRISIHTKLYIRIYCCCEWTKY
jgi:SnoaL-like polyketide cyclase